MKGGKRDEGAQGRPELDSETEEQMDTWVLHGSLMMGEPGRAELMGKEIRGC